MYGRGLRSNSSSSRVSYSYYHTRTPRGVRSTFRTKFGVRAVASSGKLPSSYYYLLLLLNRQPATNFVRNKRNGPAVDSVPYDGVGPCARILICIDMAVIVFITYLIILSTERVNQSIGVVCRREKHTNNKDGGKQVGSRGISS